MSNATTLQTNNNKISTNNTDLASILNTINNLPEAESSGLQEENVDVSLTISASASSARPRISYLTYENGAFTPKLVFLSTSSYSATLSVAKGSSMHLQLTTDTYKIQASSTSGDIETFSPTGSTGILIAKINGASSLTVVTSMTSSGDSND